MEIFLERLYESKGITEHTKLSTLKHTDYPILEDLYDFAQELNQYEEKKGNISARNCKGLVLKAEIYLYWYRRQVF